jgi:hypothetical protein
MQEMPMFAVFVIGNPRLLGSKLTNIETIKNEIQ